MRILEYRRPSPHGARISFWKSEAGGWVGMAISLVAFVLAPFLAYLLLAAISRIL